MSVAYTKELMVDFWRNATPPVPLVISEDCVENVDENKFFRYVHFRGSLLNKKHHYVSQEFTLAPLLTILKIYKGRY